MVFWPPVLLIAAALVLDLGFPELFLRHLTSLNLWVLETFGVAFAAVVLASLFMAVAIMVTPFGKVRLGGPHAKPDLRPWSWICVALATNTAVGILFWAAAEPLYHLKAPPASLGLEPFSKEAARFALSTLYLHWSFLPCALYGVSGVMFGFAFYNMKTDFSLGASLAPLFGKNLSRSSIGAVIDGLCLFALVAGMAASLATGTLTLSGGLEHLWGFKSTPLVWSVVTLTVVAAFVLSATTGLQKGITVLAGINLWIFVGLATFVALGSPLINILGLAGDALGDHITHFLATATTLRFAPQEPWVSQWTFFYWAVWLAWTPITAVFLGRIGYGYRVREFMVVNFIIPSLFALVWMSLFGGAALNMELSQNLSLVKSLESRGPEAIIYQLLANLPGGGWVIPIFLFSVFIAYVSGADANTAAMAGMCSHGICPKQTEPPKRLKYIWGVLVGIVSLAMLQAAGVDGIKMLSNLGGLPALVYQVFVLMSLGVVLVKFQKLDVYARPIQSYPSSSGAVADVPTLPVEDH